MKPLNPKLCTLTYTLSRQGTLNRADSKSVAFMGQRWQSFRVIGFEVWGNSWALELRGQVKVRGVESEAFGFGVSVVTGD